MFFTIVIAVVVFGMLILIHEIGHFVAARWAGIRVLEFSLGMGPCIFKKHSKGTQYSIRLLPFGGYVKMEGEDGDESYDDDDEESLAHEYTDAEIAGKSYYDVSAPKRAVALVAGSFMNILLGFVIIVLMLTFSSEPCATTTVDSFRTQNASSMAKGLMPGDRIIKMDSKRINVFDDIWYYIIYHTDGTTDITVKRGNEKILISGVSLPYKEYDKSEITGDKRDEGIAYRIYSIDFYVKPQKLTFFPLIKESFFKSLALARVVWQGVFDLVRGRAPIRDVSGPVGISNAIGAAAKEGLPDLLNMVVLITINLGVMNLLPLPALDGGKLLLAVFEAVTKKRLNPKVEGAINLVGFAALMVLIVFATYNDIWRLFG